MPDHVQPPRVRLTLRVGVAGSPRETPVADAAHFAERVQAVLRLIKNTACDPRAGRGSFNTDEEPRLRIVTTLADDTDREIADVAVREFGYEVQCILPFSRPSTPPPAGDPSSRGHDTVVFELDGERRTRRTERVSDESANRMVLEHCDVLLIVCSAGEARERGSMGYLHGVRSSRKLARLTRQEAAFVYLAGGGQPNYRTPARFRRENAAAFTTVFQETVILALRLGLAKLGHVALDGTKLRASTSKHKAMSYGRMRQREAQLQEEIARLAQQAEAQDTTEDREYGTDWDGYSVAEELALRERRLAKIRALRERLEAEQRAEQGVVDEAPPVIDDKEQRSFADGDARMMLMKRVSMPMPTTPKPQ